MWRHRVILIFKFRMVYNYLTFNIMKFKTLISFVSIFALICVFSSCDKEKEEPQQQTATDTADNFGNRPLPSEPFVEQLVDGGFETYWFWSEMSDGSRCIDYKSSMLLSLNCLYALKDILNSATAPITTQFDKDSHGGKYALKLITGRLVDEYDNELLIPGAIAPLNDNFIEEFLSGGSISITRPYTKTPTAIKGYFKYHPELGDSASVTVMLYNNEKEVIGVARWLQKTEVNTWTPFYEPVQYSSNETPAFISLVYASSAAYNFDDLLHCQGQEGSTLWLDDMELEF